MTCCKPTACMLVGLITGSALALTAQAQEPASDEVKALRRKTDFTADDVARIDLTVTELLNTFQQDLGTPKAGRRFEERVLAQYAHGENTPAFRKQFALRCAALFADKLKNSDPLMGVVLVQTLGAMGNTGTLEALRQAMNSDDVLTRLAALSAVGDLQPQIQGDAALLQNTLQWLEAAGARETNTLVLQRLYETIRYRDHADAQAQTLLRILQRRVEHYSSGSISAEPAEVAAYVRLSALAGGLSEADKKQLVPLLGRYLAYHTHRYIYADLSRSARLALYKLIFTNEHLLIQLTQPEFKEPPIAAAIGSASEERYKQMVAAFDRWVGTTAEAGPLNGTRWNVARGGDVAGLDFSAEVPYHPDDPIEERDDSP